MAPRVVELVLTGSSEQAIHEIEKLVGATEASSSKMSNSFANIGKVATFALAGSAVAVAAFSIKMADSFELADARLRNSIKNTGGTFAEYAGQIDKAKSSGESLGFNNTEVENSLAKLMLATKNMGTSTRDLAIAQDIAAARGIDLNTATEMLVKVEGGRYTALTRTLGVSKDVIASFHSSADAIDYLTGKYQGSAAAAAETFQGKIKVLTAQMEDLGIKIGLALIPIIEGLATALMDGVQWFEKHRTVALALATVIGTILVAAIATYIVKLIEAAAVGTLNLFAPLIDGALLLLPKIGAVIDALGAMTIAEIAAGVAVTGGLLAIGGLIVWLESGRGAYERITDAAKKWADTQITQAHAIGDNQNALVSLQASQSLLKTKIDDLTETQKHLNDVTYTGGQASMEHRRRLEELAAQILSLKTKSSDLQPEIDKLKTAHHVAAVAADAQNSALNQLTDGVQLTAPQVKALTKAIQEQQNTLLSAEGGVIGYNAAVLAEQSAEEQLTALKNSGTATTLQLQQAENQVEQAKLAVVSAALKQQSSQENLNALIAGPTVGGLVDMRTKLENAAWAAGGTNSALNDQVAVLDLAIGRWHQLHDAPDITKTISFNVNWDSYQTAQTAFDNIATRQGASGVGVLTHAAGGPVSPGQMYLVGEQGPELFVSSQAGNIIPNGASGTGGATYVTVNVAGNVWQTAELAAAIAEVFNRAGGPQIRQRAIVSA